MPLKTVSNISLLIPLLLLLAACSGETDTPENDSDNDNTDVLAPSAPTNLIVNGAVQSNSVSIVWDASTDNVAVAGYRIFRDNSLLAEITQTRYTDNTVSESQRYQYQVVAFDAAQNTASVTLTVNTPASTPASDNELPTAPANLKLSSTPTANSVSIEWDASTDNTAVAGYRILRNGNLLTETVQTNYTDNTVSGSQSYQYLVVAFDSAQNSASSTLTVNTPANVPPPDTEPPSAPKNLKLSATPTTNSVSIEWNASTDNTGVSGYRVIRDNVVINQSIITTTNYTDISVIASTAYRYQVSALDAAGNSTLSSSIDVTTPELMTALNDTFSTPYQSVLNANLSVNDNSSPNSPTTWLLVTQASSGIAIVNSNGSFTYTPATDFSGSTSFTYRMRDAQNNFSNTATVVITVQEQQQTTACSGLYADSGGYTPVTTRTLTSIPSITKPVKGVHYLDSNYATCIVRVSDHANDSNTIANRIVPDYSRRQVFNADQSQMLLLASDGFWHLYDAITYRHIRRVSLQGDSVEFQWHPTDPSLLYRMPFNGGRQIFLHDLSDTTDNTFTEVANFTAVSAINGYPGVTDINDIWPGATRFLTGEEGAPSRDGRYWALMGMSNDFNTQYGMIVYDLQTDAIVGVYDYASDGNGVGGPNNLSMSPSGTHVVVLWNPPACDGLNGRPSGAGTLNTPCGTMAFNKDFTQATGIAVNGEHGDTATDINGRDVYVGIEYQSRGAIEIIDLQTGNLVGEIETSVWEGAVHISGRALDKPGWVVVSHYTANAASVWYNQEIFLARLDTTPVIVRLAKHQSNPADYWAQPHATISRDASKVVWGSNWGGSILDIDTYMAIIPIEALDDL